MPDGSICQINVTMQFVEAFPWESPPKTLRRDRDDPGPLFARHAGDAGGRRDEGGQGLENCAR